MTEPRPEDAPEAGDVPMSVLGVRVELPAQHHVRQRYTPIAGEAGPVRRQ